VAAVERVLITLVEFRDCGISLIDFQRHRYVDYETATGRIIEKHYETLPRALGQAMETGRPVY